MIFLCVLGGVVAEDHPSCRAKNAPKYHRDPQRVRQGVIGLRAGLAGAVKQMEIDQHLQQKRRGFKLAGVAA